MSATNEATDVVENQTSEELEELTVPELDQATGGFGAAKLHYGMLKGRRNRRRRNNG